MAKASRTTPERSADEFFRRSNQLLEAGRYAEAAAAAERAVALDPQHGAAAYSRALATLNVGNETEAERLFGLVPTSDRKIFGSAMAARAHLLEERGDVEELVATLTRWIEVYTGGALPFTARIYSKRNGTARPDR